MNTLVSLGAVTAYVASVVALLWPQLTWECFFDAPVMIVGLILLGRTLEEQARGQATAALEALINLQPAIARLIPHYETQPDHSVEVPVDQVDLGARLKVLPGDQVPVDGFVISGETLTDESMLTVEALPVAKAAGDRITAGTLNQSGVVVIEATQTGSDTTLARIIQMVENAQARKAPIQRLADVVAGYFTYGVMAIALLTFLFWVGVGAHLWPQIVAQTPSPGSQYGFAWAWAFGSQHGHDTQAPSRRTIAEFKIGDRRPRHCLSLCLRLSNPYRHFGGDQPRGKKGVINQGRRCFRADPPSRYRRV